MDRNFQDKIAVITGGGGVLCSAIALHLAQKGCRIVLLGRTLAPLEKVAEEIRQNGGICLSKTCDVSNEGEIQRVADEVLAELGPCNFLINGAGGNNAKAITTRPDIAPEELDETMSEDHINFFNMDMGIFESVLRINILGTISCCRVFGKQMVAAGGGAIINFGSMNSYRPLSKLPAYALSKAAILNFTQWLAKYMAPSGIRVNGVAPGFFLNNRNVQWFGSPEAGYTQRGLNVMRQTPMGRFGQAKELVGTVEWLLNEEASGYVTGIMVPVDGGFLTDAGL